MAEWRVTQRPAGTVINARPLVQARSTRATIAAAVRRLLGVGMARSVWTVAMELPRFISAGGNDSNRTLGGEKTSFIRVASNVALLFPKAALEIKMRRSSPTNCILVIACGLVGLALPGSAGAAGQAGQIAGFPNTGARSEASGAGDDVGLGLFSNIPFHFTVTVRGGYDDNSTTGQAANSASGFVNSTINMTYDFGSPRTRLSLQLGGGITDYFDRPGGGIDYNGFLGLSLRHAFSARLVLNLTTYTAYQSEPDFSLGTGFNRRSGNYFYTNDKASVNYLWAPRFSTVTSYTFDALVYDNSGPAGVGSFENRVENTFGNEFRFLLLPTATVVAEYRIQFVDYQDMDVNAITQFILAGFNYSFSPRLNIVYRGGLQTRSLDSNQVVPASFQLVNGVFVFIPKHTLHTSEDSVAPYFEAIATYVVGKQTSISWTSRYGIEEPDIPGQPGRTTYRTGLEGKHNWTARISSRLAAFYSHDHYGPANTSPAFNEDSLDMALSLRYAITRYLGVETGYNHTEIFSDISSRGYSRNRFYAGADFTF